MTTKNNSITGVSPTSIQDIYTVNAAVDSGYVIDTSTGKWAFTDTTNSYDSDITIDGKSIRQFMKSVEERLAILEPNKNLEAEWAELKALGERYRAMEDDLLEKARVWQILKD